MSHQGLGDSRQMVLLAVLHLKGDVYGVPIVHDSSGARDGKATGVGDFVQVHPGATANPR